MKTLLIILGAMVAQLRAESAPMDEITLILWRRQTYLMTHEDKLAVRLAQLMEVLGKETEAYSAEQITALKPDQFEDRLRLIALARVQHPELFEEIFNAYVKPLSEEEMEKRLQAVLQSQADKVSAEEWKKMKEQAETMMRAFVKASSPLAPPTEIQPKHLEGLYRFCFEYFLMSPRFKSSHPRCDTSLQTALNQIREKTDGVDMRKLIEERLKTFDPTRDPNFQREDP